jgi:hypothetical protein
MQRLAADIKEAVEGRGGTLVERFAIAGRTTAIPLAVGATAGAAAANSGRLVSFLRQVWSTVTAKVAAAVVAVVAGLPLMVLPEMFFPRRNDKVFEKAVSSLASLVEAPLQGAGAEAGFPHCTHTLQERVLVLCGNGIGSHNNNWSGMWIKPRNQLRLGPVDRQATIPIRALGSEERPESNGGCPGYDNCRGDEKGSFQSRRPGNCTI